MERNYSDGWWFYLIKGLFIMLTGAIALLMPGPAFASLVLLFAVFMMADGILAVVFSINMRSQVQHWVWWMLLGLAGIIAGIFTFARPVTAGVLLVYFVSSWVLFTGITEIIVAVSMRRQIRGEGWYIASGILSVVFSILLFNYPIAAVFTMTMLFGVYTVLTGVSLITLSVRLKKRNYIQRGKGRYNAYLAIE